MAFFDVFNGDADGLCALHQLRLVAPQDAELVTGTKRDIALLGRVDAHAGDTVTVLDVSIDVNRHALLALLERGVTIKYFDHHGSGNVPVHTGLQAYIDNTPDVCTAILVDRWLDGAQRIWAVIGAFGDNLVHAARKLVAQLPLQESQLATLQELGACLNYNAYGDSCADLIVHPADLYRLLRRYADPFDFIAAESVFQILREARHNELALARREPPYASLPCGSIVVLPDAAWSRRVRGAYGNLLAAEAPPQAHAVLTPNIQGGYTVSVRAPLATLRGADRLCRSFPTGGGRPAAAGINRLSQDDLPAFVRAFEQVFGMQ